MRHISLLLALCAAPLAAQQRDCLVHRRVVGHAVEKTHLEQAQAKRDDDDLVVERHLGLHVAVAADHARTCAELGDSWFEGAVAEADWIRRRGEVPWALKLKYPVSVEANISRYWQAFFDQAPVFT